MADTCTVAAPETSLSHTALFQPPAACPEVSPKFLLSESEKERHAEGMTDEELARHVESNLRPVGETLRSSQPAETR